MTQDLRLALIACKRALMRLQSVSDAPTSAPLSDRTQYTGPTGSVRLRSRQTRQGKGLPHNPHGASREPPQSALDGPPAATHAPSKRLSLYAHYLWRMQRAQRDENLVELQALSAMATRDYLEHIGKWRPRNHEHHDAAVGELLDNWTGHPSGEAAIWLKQAERWVRRQRVLHGRDPDLGELRHADERTGKIISLASRGASQRAIASEVGMSQQRVSQVLAGA